MFGSNVKLDKDLLAKVKKYADIAGYSSPEEFITHALEKELALLEDADSEEEIRKGLAGNLCMCTGYMQIVEAVKSAAKNWKNG